MDRSSRHCSFALTAAFCVATLCNFDWRAWPIALPTVAKAQSIPPPDGARPSSEEVDLPTPPVLLLDQVVELERLLIKLGFEPGKADGLIDGETRSAIRSFQELADLAVDGEPSQELLEALREIAAYQSNGG